MTNYDVGTAFVQVVPSFRGVQAALEREIAQFGPALDNAIGKSIRDGIAKGSKDAGREGSKAGEAYAGEFGNSMRRRLESAFKGFREVKIGADSSEADRAIAHVREEIASLLDRHVKVNISEAEAEVKAREILAMLDEIDSKNVTAEVHINSRAVRAEFEEVVALLRSKQADLERIGREAGEAYGGRFGESFRERIDAALRNLPTAHIDAEASAADRAVEELRARLESLRGRTIGLGLTVEDEAEALAELKAVQDELERIARIDPSVRIRTNAAATAAELAALREELGLVSRSDVSINVRADGVDESGNALANLAQEAENSFGRLGALIALGASLGTAIVPAAAAAAAAVGAIGTAAAAAASGIGVFALGISGIGGAIQALNKYANDTSKSNASLATSQHTLAGAVASVESAERSLANTRASVADAARRAGQQVVDAQRGVADAEKGVVDAQRGVVDAQRAAVRVQDDLTKAVEAYRRTQEDEALQLRENALAQRQANLDIADAKKTLDQILSNPRATEAEREQARITYEQRSLQLTQLQVKQQRLAEDQAAQARAGVEGSDQVVAAQDRIRQAADNVAKAHETVERAQERVVAAQQRVADAAIAQQQQQRQGQYQIVQAQQAVINAQRQVEQATVRSGVAGGAALSNLQTAMDQLSPAGQRFARFIFGLKDQFKALRDVAQQNMLPGLQEAITSLLPAMPGLSRFIGEVAAKLGSIFEQVAGELRNPVWRQFFGYVRDTAAPALQGMFEFSANAARGLASLFLALTPFNASIGGGLLSFSERFANWAAALAKTDGYQRFLAYVRDAGPKVLELLGAFAGAVENLVVAAAPVGLKVVEIFTALFHAIDAVPVEVLAKIVAGVAGISAGVLALVGVTKVWSLTKGIFDVVKSAAGGVKTVFDRLAESGQRAATAASNFGELGRYAFTSYHNAVADAAQRNREFGNGLTTMRGEVSTALGRVGDAARAGFGRYQDALLDASARTGNFGGAVAHLDVAANAVRGSLGAVGSGFAAIGRSADTVGNTIADAARRVGGAITGVGDAARSGFGRYQDALTEASARTGNFGGAIAHLDVAAGVARSGLSKLKDMAGEATNVALAHVEVASGIAKKGVQKLGDGMNGLIGVLGGPWGAALTVAGAGLSFFVEEQLRAKQEADQLKQSLSSYGDVLKNGITPDSVLAAKSILKTNEQLRGFVDATHDAGISTKDLVDGLNGSSAARQLIVDTLDRQITAEKVAASEARNGSDAETEASKAHSDRAKALETMRIEFAKVNSENREANRLTEIMSSDYVATSDAAKKLQPTIDLLTDAYHQLGDKTGTAAEKADALRSANEKMHKPTIDAVEAAEAQARATDSLTDSVAANTAGYDLDAVQKKIATDVSGKHKGALKDEQQAVLNNRDALEAALKATNDEYFANLAAGQSVEIATQKHDDHVAAILREIPQVDRNSGAVRNLVDQYGTIPDQKTTQVSMDGADAVLKQLGDLKVAQYALDHDLSITESRNAIAGSLSTLRSQVPRSGQGGGDGYGIARQDGGPVRGPGGPRDDLVPAVGPGGVRYRLSDNEHIITAEEVAAAGGHQQVQAIRQAMLMGAFRAWSAPPAGYATGAAVGKPKERFADGGPVWMFPVNVSHTKIPGSDDILNPLIGGNGAGTAMGWQRQMELLRAAFPGLALFSGFRPHSVTVSGNTSYHALGRAVDVPPRPDVFEWIRTNYGSSTKELIFTPKGIRQIWNGKPHIYSGPVAAEHYCVPMDTEILTRRGWVMHDQVQPGDETLGLNFDTGKTEWTPIVGVVRYDDAELIEARSHAWTVRTTGGHRWVARDSKTGIHYWNTTDGRREGTPPVARAKFQDTWVIAAEMADGPGLNLTIDEAELLGWLVTDGGQHDGFHHRGTNFSVHVWQTKPAGVRRLGEILSDESAWNRKAAWNGKGYRLRNAYARDLLSRAGITHIKDASQLLPMVAAMTAAQRRGMLAGVIGGDGNGIGQVMQNEGPLLDVITTLAYTCGYRTTVTKHQCSERCWGHKGNPLVVNLGQPRVTTDRQGRTAVGRAPVWCPTTALGTWTAKFGNNVVLTGNSHVHWAMDQGGLIQPGWNPPIFNGTGKPEPVLNPGQWGMLQSLAEQAQGGGGDTHHWTFKDTTLTPGRLRALQDADAARSRAGRAR